MCITIPSTTNHIRYQEQKSAPFHLSKLSLIFSQSPSELLLLFVSRLVVESVLLILFSDVFSTGLSSELKWSSLMSPSRVFSVFGTFFNFEADLVVVFLGLAKITSSLESVGDIGDFNCDFERRSFSYCSKSLICSSSVKSMSVAKSSGSVIRVALKIRNKRYVNVGFVHFNTFNLEGFIYKF